MRDIRQELPQPIRVLLLCPDSGLQEQIQQFFSNEDRYPITLVDSTRSLDYCRLLIHEALPHVVLLADVAQGGDWTSNLLEISKEINLANRNMTSILLAPQIDVQYLQLALNAGARGVVEIQRFGSDWTTIIGEIERAILQAYEFIRVRSEGGFFNAQGQVYGRKESNVITFFSGKGGVGKSVLASGLATHLAQLFMDSRTVLVDLDMQFGMAAPILGVDPIRTMTQLVPLVQEINSDGVQEFLTTRTVGDGATLSVMAAPRNSLELPSISTQSTAALLSVLRRNFQWVVVDLPSQITDATITALQMSDHILMVCEPDMLAIRAARQAMNLLKDPSLGVHAAEIHIVLNKVRPQSVIKEADVRSLFPNIAATFPYDPIFVDEHVSSGEPFGAIHPQHKILTEMDVLARKFMRTPTPTTAAQTEAEPKKKGFGLPSFRLRGNNG